MIKPSLLGNREQMRTVLQLAAEGKVRTVVDRFPMEEATEVLELLASGKLRSRGVLENSGERFVTSTWRVWFFSSRELEP